MALNTSGTLQVQAWDTRTVIDRAYGTLGFVPQKITSEMIQIALDLLGIGLADMVNTSSPLWCLEKLLLPLVQGQRSITLPIGTNDVNRAFYRTVNNITPATVNITPSYYQFDFGAGQVGQVYNWSITWSGSPIPVIFQSSPDGINWTQVAASNALNYNLEGSNSTQWYDMSNSNAQRFWQVIPAPTLNGQTITPANTLSITSAAVYNTPNDIEMYRMNKDDYYNMTNKSFQGRPLQYYVNRTVASGTSINSGVIMDLWPIPDALSAQNLILVRRQRYIMDVGSLQQAIEVPTRWFYTAIFMLGDALSFCTPEVDPGKAAMVQARYQQMLQNAWGEERDRSPAKFNVNISPYTR